MIINCLICSDNFLPHAEIYTTPCGHLFHHICLIHWLERSKTCPQCRNRTTEKTIHRIYFNISNTDHIVEDVGTLQNKIDNFQFQMTLKEKDIKITTDKYKKVKIQNAALREEICELENKIRGHDSVVHALKDQISFLKSRSKERDRLTEEVSRLKSRLKEVEFVQTAINGTREEVNNILKNDTDTESLVILAATLKKALVDAEKKKLNVEQKFKQLQFDIARYRREISSLETSNEQLKKELELSKKSWVQEKEYLTNMVLSEKNTPTIKRIMSESPIPLPQNRPENMSENSKSDKIKSPSVEEKVKNILESNSPYLPVKSSSIIDYKAGGNEKCPQLSSSSNEMSIFNKRAPSRLVILKKPHSNKEVVYNGLGGQNKEDVFPSPKTSVSGIKRHMSSVGVSSGKFRKISSFKMID